MHSFPQIGFKQHHTNKIILDFLKNELFIPSSSIKILAGTGIICDLYGTMDSILQLKIVAFRADIDALNMLQTSQLPYKSKNENAHMCGHDGHTSTLLYFAYKFLKNKEIFPKTRAVRLIFQPSQQGPQSGALAMIKQGCLHQVQQIFGYHNWPTKPRGQLWVKQGAVMSQVTIIKLQIKGTSGHGSQPLKVLDSIRGARFFLDQVDILNAQLNSKGINYVLTFPVFQGGQRYNVFSEKTRIEGTMRSFVQKQFQVQHGLNSIVQQLKEKGYEVNFIFKRVYPVNINSKKQSKIVQNAGKGIFMVSKGQLPFYASQDFAFYTKIIPGSFFFVSSLKQEQGPMLHSSKFDFNDQITENVSEVYYNIAKQTLIE